MTRLSLDRGAPEGADLSVRAANDPRDGTRSSAGEHEALTEWATEITEVAEDDTTGTPGRSAPPVVRTCGRGTSTAASAVVPKILAVAVL
jgi:hypothetical protein